MDHFFIPRLGVQTWVAGALTALIIFIVFPLFSFLRMLILRSRLPPGPFPLPIVGNVFQLPASKPWLKYEEWSKKYNSGLITVWIGRVPNVICNDAWSANDLMEKKSSIYSSRPEYVSFGKLTGKSKLNQVLLPYNDHWKRQRRTMHAALSPSAVRAYRSFQADESRVLMQELLTDPTQFAHYYERYAASLVSILGWGRRISSLDDPVMKLALASMDRITMMQVPGHYWIDTIPEMQYLPKWLYALPTQLKKNSANVRKFWWALDLEASSKEVDSFSKSLIHAQEKEGLTQDDIGEMTANLIGGGLDTTSSTLHTLTLGLCLFPEALKKAHDELDRVVGGDRMPDWDDLENLPYCLATFKEAIRWRSVTALGGFAHAPIQDDKYKNYEFPAGIAIFGNLWAIHRNPKDFPEPDVFNPDRYLAENRKPYPNKIGHNGFGWGRRTCSGQYFAEQSLSMTIARFLWCFNIRPGLDEEGHEVTLDKWAYTDNENTQPLPFKARFIPRTEKIKEIVVEEANLSRERLAKWDTKLMLKVEDFIKQG